MTCCLTVRLLEPGAGTLTTELLGLAPSVVGNEECAVVGNEGLLELVLAVLIDELLVVGDLWSWWSADSPCSLVSILLFSSLQLAVTYDGLGNGLTDGVDLGSLTTTGDADADVDVGCEEGKKESKSALHVPMEMDSFQPDASCRCASVHSCSSCSVLSVLREPVSSSHVVPGASLCRPIQLFSAAAAAARRIKRTELVKAEDEDGLVDLESQDLRLNKAEGLAVDLDEALASLAVCDGGRSLLLAEALHALGGRRHDGRDRERKSEGDARSVGLAMGCRVVSLGADWEDSTSSGQAKSTRAQLQNAKFWLCSAPDAASAYSGLCARCLRLASRRPWHRLARVRTCTDAAAAPVPPPPPLPST